MSIGLNVLGLDALGLDALGLDALGLNALGLNALGLNDLGLNDQTLVSLKTTNVYNEEQGCVCVWGGGGGYKMSTKPYLFLIISERLKNN